MSQLTRADVEVGLVAAGVEDRLQQLRRSGERERAALEQAREVAARGAEIGGERDAREERRAAPRRCWRWRRAAGARRRGCRGAARAGRTAGPAERRPGSAAAPSGSGGGRSAGSGWPTSSCKRVLVERALAQRLGERRLRAFELRLGLAVVELRGRAVVEAQLGDAGRLLARRQRLARDAQLLVVGEQRQVGVGDRRDEADLDRLAGLGGREVLRQRRLAQVVDAAEQVELVAGDGEADRVHRRDAVADRRARRRRADADRRQLVGAADLVDRSRLLDVEDGDAQVAVVGERELDQALQARVGEEALPVDVGGGLGAGRARPA